MGHSPLEHFGSKNLLPVCSAKIIMAAKNRVFANNLRSNGRIFKIPSAYVHLRYADDTALCADNHEDICKLLNNINEEGKKKNMKLNAKKTKVMHVGRGDYEDIEIDGEI